MLRLEFGHFAEGDDIIKVYKLVFGDSDGMKMCEFVSKIRIYKEALFGGNFESYPMSSPTYSTFDFDRGFELSTKALLCMTNLDDCHSIPEYEDAVKYTLENNLAGHILDPLEMGGYFHVMIVSFFEKNGFTNMWKSKLNCLEFEGETNQFPGQQADILAVIRFSELEQGAMKKPIAAHSLPRETPCVGHWEN